MQNNTIQTQARPNCPVCQSQGSLLYAELTDRLFNVEGNWNMKRCNNIDCGTLWLDPTPTEENLPKLYSDYCTHNDLVLPRNLLRTALAGIQAAYLQTRYGYESSLPKWATPLLAYIAYLHPAWKDALDASVFYLPARQGGHLLEVGCGSGATLQSIATKGWQVTGVDLDEAAVKNARSKGLEVHQGSLCAQNFMANSFDAIVMSHLIEHVPNPTELLNECYKLLKKDGVLIALTPNAGSDLHKYYGRNWIGLDAPRHLQIFTLKSLANIATKTNYSSVKVFSTMHGIVFHELASTELALGKKHSMGNRGTLTHYILGNIKGLFLGWLHKLSLNSGVEAVLICKK